MSYDRDAQHLVKVTVDFRDIKIEIYKIRCIVNKKIYTFNLLFNGSGNYADIFSRVGEKLVNLQINGLPIPNLRRYEIKIGRW